MPTALARIATHAGIRLEMLHPIPFEDDLLLSVGNSFCARASDGTWVSVGGWDADACRVQRTVALCHEAGSGLHYDASDDEEDYNNNNPPSPGVKRVTGLLRRLSMDEMRRKRRRMRSSLHLFLTDSAMEVAYVWIIPFSDISVRRMAVFPHPPRAFTIENCCGSFKGLYDVDFTMLKRMSQQRAVVDIVSMLGGTLSLFPERRQVDFRGVRTLRALAVDWECATGKQLQDSHVTAYMLVLKGRLGSALLLESPYLINRVQGWCKGGRKGTDVCECIELYDINWGGLFDFFFGTECVPLLLSGRCTVNISRRGGVMMRILFPRDTAWSLPIEEAVLRDCNRLLDVLRAALSGKRL